MPFNVSEFLAGQGYSPENDLPAADTQDTSYDSDGSDAEQELTYEGQGATEGEGGEPALNQGQVDNSANADAFTDRFDPNTLDPALVPAYRQLQADYTRKTQELAEARRAFQQDPVAQVVQTVQQLAQSNPAGLVAYLETQLDDARKWAVQMGYAPQASQPAPASAADVEIDPDALTDTERAIFGQLQQVAQELSQAKQQLQQFQPVVQQQAQQRALAEVEAAFAKLETGVLNRQLTPQERDELATFAAQMGARSYQQLEAAAKAWEYDRAKQRGRDEASASVPAKQGMRPGSGGRPVTPGAGAGAAPAQQSRGKMSISALVDQAMAGKLA